MVEKGIVCKLRKIEKENRVIWILLLILGMLLFVYCRQMYGVHGREENMCGMSEISAVELTKETNYKTFFCQTGLGKAAVEKLLEREEWETLRGIQQDYLKPVQVRCEPVFGWFTREDRLIATEESYDMGPDFADLQPGDILLTLSTHSLGWRHGHVGLVIDEETTLESVILGEDSAYGDPQNWRKYASYCVLRVKGVSPKLQQEVVKYACENLYDVPYHLSAGFLKDKAPSPDSRGFGLHCGYLVWYAWNQFGYDLDSDGGRLVTASDLLASELLEVVQVYGME